MTAFHPEDRARASIDDRLSACGWVVQSRAGLDLSASLGIAVREFQTPTGPCDYALFVDRGFCGVVEAKSAGATLSGFADQAERYLAEPPPYLQVDPKDLRFEYVASQTEILFRDHADPAPRSRRVFAFHRPETLQRWLGEPETLRARLRRLPPLVRDGLRDCQIEAIQGLESSLARDDPRALVQMTMGAGKTFAACTFSYRFLAHAGMRRILFLVDRRNLGTQAAGEYAAYRPPGTGRLFPEIYGVQRLGSAGLDAGATIVIATIQRVYAALMGEALSEEEEEQARAAVERGEESEKLVAYNAALPIEAFDLIVTDECHRSIYGTWRQVLEYFDAPIVGLTATPSIHTLGFFNRNLVAEYPYERSVADGVNVGYEIFRVRTRIGEGGSWVEKGYAIPVRDNRTRAERYETLDADLVYGKADLDRSVLAPNQIRTVLETYRDSLPRELFPGRERVPKTLIFAKDDHHAEEIVMLAREVFGQGNDFAKKITYRIDGADPEALIKQFRNHYYPRIAVTVDMIATGTDIKPIEVLIFLRDVRSAGYYEQMLGRGVRAIDPTDLRSVTPDADAKTRFVLIDAVGVTESRKSLSPPLDRERALAFDTLLDRVAAGDRRDDTLSTLAARLAALDRRIDPQHRAELAAAAGGRPLASLAQALLEAIDPDALAAAGDEGEGPSEERLKEAACRSFDDPGLRQALKDAKAAADVRIDSISTDAVISSGYDLPQAQATVDRFRAFLEANRDTLVALQILYARPYAARRLTYAGLEALREALRRPPWLLEPVEIWRAYRRLDDTRVRGNPTRILTDVVMLVRYALGLDSVLEPLPAKVAGRFNLWLGREKNAGRTYGDEQVTWLTTIRDHLAVNAEVAPRDLQDLAAFADKGGLLRARDLFGDRLESLLDDLAEALIA